MSARYNNSMSTGYDYSMSAGCSNSKPEKPEIFEIDGSVLEGGGQILRISISLSAILGIPIRVKNIRSGRPKPGLAAQHLKGIELVAEMCRAKLKGVAFGSTEIEFIPGGLQGGTFFADTQTAGSISLLLQVALPCALFAPEPVTLELKGGTNVAMAPQIDYMTKIFAPVLRNFDANFCVEIIKRGYYPRGGGHVRVSVMPVKVLRAAMVMDRGRLERITGWSHVAGSVPLPVAKQMVQAARQELQSEAPVYIQTYREGKDVSRDNGWGILLMAETTSGCVLGADGLGERDAEPAAVGTAAAQQLREELHNGACFDSYAQDQIVLYLALANGFSSVRMGELTLHARTAMYVAELLTDVRFKVIPLSLENVVQCTGLGFVNKYIR